MPQWAPLKKFRTLLFVSFLLLSLTSCSSKFAYGFLDWAMMWYIDSYVSLNKEQKTFAKASVKDFHLWHKTTQLEPYAKYIEGLKPRLEQQLTGEAIHAETDKVQELLDASFNKLIPALAELCVQLTPEQITEIKAHLQKEQKKYRKKYVEASQKKRYTLRKNELVDYLAPFFGKFTAEQKTWINDWSHSLMPYEELNLRQQEIWEETFTKAMTQRNDREKLEGYLRELMLYQTDNWQPELEKRMDINQDLTYELIAKLFNNRTKSQRSKTNKKLDSYLEDLHELIKEAQSNNH